MDKTAVNQFNVTGIDPWNRYYSTKDTAPRRTFDFQVFQAYAPPEAAGQILLPIYQLGQDAPLRNYYATTPEELTTALTSTQQNWTFEGIAFLAFPPPPGPPPPVGKAPPQGPPGTVPVYKFHVKELPAAAVEDKWQRYFSAEIKPAPGWASDGFAFYAYP